MIPPEQTAKTAEEQLLIYARELQELYQQQRQQLQALQQLYAELQTKEQQRAALLGELLTAQEQERGRIARDVHDGPLQDLGVLLLSVERCKRQIESGATSEALLGLSNLRQEAQQTIGALRTLISDLRPGVLDTYGLLGALDYLAGRIGRESAITINISSRLGSRLDPNLEVVIFRLVQEALTNIRKHAQAQHAWVMLQRHGAKLHLDVRDDGQGFAAADSIHHALATGHIGLASMRERAELAGGTLTIESAADQGTVIHVVLPFLTADSAPAARPISPPPASRLHNQ